MSSSDSDSDLSDGHSSAEEHASHEGEAALPQPGKRKRKNRHKPMEMSSKRPVPAVRQAVEVPKRQVRGPCVRMLVISATAAAAVHQWWRRYRHQARAGWAAA